MTMGPEYQLYLYSFQIAMKLFWYYKTRRDCRTILIYEERETTSSTKEEKEDKEQEEEEFLLINKNEQN